MLPPLFLKTALTFMTSSLVLLDNKAEAVVLLFKRSPLFRGKLRILQCGDNVVKLSLKPLKLFANHIGLRMLNALVTE